MRKTIFASLFLSTLILPVAAQDIPEGLRLLHEERFKGMRQLENPKCSTLVQAAAKARIQRATESIRRLFPEFAEQYDKEGWPELPDEDAITGQENPEKSPEKPRPPTITANPSPD